MADVNYYSGGRTRTITAETINSHNNLYNDAWVRIRILDGDHEVGVVNIFGAATVNVLSKDDAAQQAA